MLDRVIWSNSLIVILWILNLLFLAIIIIGVIQQLSYIFGILSECRQIFFFFFIFFYFFFFFFFLLIKWHWKMFRPIYSCSRSSSSRTRRVIATLSTVRVVLELFYIVHMRDFNLLIIWVFHLPLINLTLFHNLLGWTHHYFFLFLLISIYLNPSEKRI